MKRANCFNTARGHAVWAASILLAFGLNSATARPPQPPPKYTVIDLGTLPDRALTVYGGYDILNNRGQVVGCSFTDLFADGTGFFWQKGEMTPLPLCRPGAVTAPQAINEYSQIVAQSGPDFGDLRAFVLVAGAWVELPRLEGFENTWAIDINNCGTICGYVWKDLGLFGLEPPLPVVWREGRIQMLPILDLGPTLTQSGSCNALNDRDQIVGTSGDWVYDEQGNFKVPYYHATLWDRGQAIDLSGPVYGNSVAFGINNAGAVVGTITRYIPDPYDPKDYGFVWTKAAGLVDLPGTVSLPYGEAYGINDAGEIIGRAAPVFIPFSTVLNRHAVLWKNGAMYDLNVNLPAGSEWILNDAIGINARGQIVAQGFNPMAGLLRLFLLDPQPASAPTPVED